MFFFFETHTREKNICFNTKVHQKLHLKVIIIFFLDKTMIIFKGMWGKFNNLTIKIISLKKKTKILF